MGGFIAAKQPLIDHYLMNARQRLMSIALTIPDTAALIEAVDMLSEDTRLIDKLWGNVDYLRKGVHAAGAGTRRLPTWRSPLGGRHTRYLRSSPLCSLPPKPSAP